MAPQYSKKKAKFTYTERKHRLDVAVTSLVDPSSFHLGVLGALSDLQKEHRKHAVHMATLRAHGTSASSSSSRGLDADHLVV